MPNNKLYCYCTYRTNCVTVMPYIVNSAVMIVALLQTDSDGVKTKNVLH